MVRLSAPILLQEPPERKPFESLPDFPDCPDFFGVFDFGISDFGIFGRANGISEALG